MADNQLPVSGTSGSQTNTASPQASAQTGNSLTSQETGGVQPGTASSLLTTSSGGVPLQNTALTTVDLGSTGQTTGSQLPAPIRAHHSHPVLFGFSALLLVVAASLFWLAARSAKNTTI